MTYEIRSLRSRLLALSLALLSFLILTTLNLLQPGLARLPERAAVASASAPRLAALALVVPRALAVPGQALELASVPAALASVAPPAPVVAGQARGLALAAVGSVARPGSGPARAWAFQGVASESPAPPALVSTESAPASARSISGSMRGATAGSATVRSVPRRRLVSSGANLVPTRPHRSRIVRPGSRRGPPWRPRAAPP